MTDHVTGRVVSYPTVSRVIALIETVRGSHVTVRTFLPASFPGPMLAFPSMERSVGCISALAVAAVSTLSESLSYRVCNTENRIAHTTEQLSNYMSMSLSINVQSTQSVS